MPFPDFVNDSTLKDGETFTLSQFDTLSSDAGYQSFNWDFSTTPPIPYFTEHSQWFDYEGDVRPFPDFTESLSLKDGQTITLLEGTSDSIYESAGFSILTYSEFSNNPSHNDWIIETNKSIPHFDGITCDYLDRSRCGILNYGEPLTATKALVVVREDELYGSMQYDGTRWYDLGQHNVSGKLYGQVGEPVTYSYYGDTFILDGITYHFLASGIRDLTGCGGYGSYTSETTRTVTLNDSYAQRVNFYYAEKQAPDYDWLISVTTSGGIINLVSLEDETQSEVRVTLPNGDIGCLPLVDISDEFASPVRIATSSGIKALQEYKEL